MGYLIFAACVVAAFAFVYFIAVPYVTRPAVLFDKGPAHAQVKGILICAVTAAALLFLFNPDHLTEIKSRFWESLALTGFSAIFWLPWFLFSFARAAEKTAEKTKASAPKDRQ